MPSDLIKALRAAAEFNSTSEYWRKKVELGNLILGPHESARLAPILEKLIAVVEAAESAREILRGHSSKGDIEIEQALADLRAAVMPKVGK